MLAVLALKGGVAKTALSINLAGWLARERGAAVAVVDGDRNRGATLYAERGSLPFEVFPIGRFRSALAAASDWLILDGQASPEPAELRDLAGDADLVLLPTTGQKVSMLLAIEAAEVLRELGTPFRVVLTRCDARQRGAVDAARSFLAAEGLPLSVGSTSALAAWEQAEAAGCLVCDAATDRGQRNPRAADAWQELSTIAAELFQ